MDTYEAIETALLARLRGREVRRLNSSGEAVSVPVPVVLEEPHTAVLETVQYPMLVLVLDEDGPDLPRMHSEEPYIAAVAETDDRGRPTSIFIEDEPQPYDFTYRIHGFGNDALMIRDLAYLVERSLPFRGALQLTDDLWADCFRMSRMNASGGDDEPAYHYVWRYAIKSRLHYPDSRTTLATRLSTVVELGATRFRSSASGLVPVDSAGNPVRGGEPALDSAESFVVEDDDFPPD